MLTSCSWLASVRVCPHLRYAINIKTLKDLKKNRCNEVVSKSTLHTFKLNVSVKICRTVIHHVANV